MVSNIKYLLDGNLNSDHDEFSNDVYALCSFILEATGVESVAYGLPRMKNYFLVYCVEQFCS